MSVFSSYGKSIFELKYQIDIILPKRFLMIWTFEGKARIMVATSYTVTGVRGYLFSIDLENKLFYIEQVQKPHETMERMMLEGAELTHDVESVVSFANLKHSNYQQIKEQEKKLLNELGIK